jgi:putative transposase
VKYAFIKSHKDEWPVRWICGALDVSHSGYYAWVKRPESNRARENRGLLAKIVHIHEASRKTYGAPRIHAELRQQQACSKNRIARLMRQTGLKTVMYKLWQQSEQGHKFESTKENILNRNFYSGQPNKRWVMDITQVPTAEGWLYLAAILDLYSRKIVGWSMKPTAYSDLAEDALQMALWRRGKVKDLLLHTDQGVQFRTGKYHAILRENKIEASMSRKANCHDNAAMESFFHTLKTEHTHHFRYKTRNEAKQSIFEYIEVFYNQQRRHSYLGYLTPDEFERQYAS